MYTFDCKALEKHDTMVQYQAVSTLVGALLMNITFGSYVCFGNMMTYIVSYMRRKNCPDLTYSQFFVTNACFSISRGIGMPLGGYLSDKIGSRACIGLGCTFLSMSVGSMYFLIQGSSLWPIYLVYGSVRGLGVSLPFIPIIKIIVAFFVKNKGLALGIAFLGFGGASVILNPIQTFLANPLNIPMDEETGYFVDDIVLDAVPMLVLYMCLMYSSTNLIGYVLLRIPGEETSLKEEITDQLDEGTCLINMEHTYEVYKHKEFYILFFTKFVLSLIYLVIESFYKAYGSFFIQDDQALSLVWTIASLVNLLSRPANGCLVDNYSYKTIMLCVVALNSFIIMTFCHTNLGGFTMLALYVSGIQGTMGFFFTVIPTACINVFGQRHGSKVFGYVQASEALVGLSAFFFNGPLLDLLGWCWYFGVHGILGGFVFLANFLFPRV